MLAQLLPELFYLSAAATLLGLAWTHLRLRNWPRVQVTVRSTHIVEEGFDGDGVKQGTLHAELEYWFKGHHHEFSWQCDLSKYKHLPPALWMLANPANPEDVRVVPNNILTFCAVMLGLMFCLPVLLSLLNLAST